MRVTLKDIQNLIDRINEVTGSPKKPYEINGNNFKHKAQIGNYHRSEAYGGVSLHRMINECGGVEDVFRCGFVPKRDLYERMQAFLEGLREGRGV